MTAFATAALAAGFCPVIRLRSSTTKTPLERPATIVVGRQQGGGAMARSDVVAARDLDALGGDPAVVGAKQTGHGRTDVVGKSHPTKRDHRGEGIVMGRRVPDGTAEETGGDGPGRDDVGRDAPAARSLAISMSSIVPDGRFVRC